MKKREIGNKEWAQFTAGIFGMISLPLLPHLLHQILSSIPKTLFAGALDG
jgi:hypothetical protein